MSKPNIVVIIAAGRGSRLRSHEGPPKPLLALKGKPLILHVLDKFARAGVQKAVVVVGHRANEVKEGVLAASPPLPVEFAFNPKWDLQNGLSVLAARELVGPNNFYLSMADHIFDISLIENLAQATIPEGGLVLGVDRKLDKVYDMPDATKVKTDGSTIVKIHKELTEFDAVDTGLFACTPGLFEAIASFSQQRADGDCTLSEGVTHLAAQNKAIVHDVGEGRWQDVDTPGAVEHAEKLFSNS